MSPIIAASAIKILHTHKAGLHSRLLEAILEVEREPLRPGKAVGITVRSCQGVSKDVPQGDDPVVQDAKPRERDELGHLFPLVFRLYHPLPLEFSRRRVAFSTRCFILYQVLFRS